MKVHMLHNIQKTENSEEKKEKKKKKRNKALYQRKAHRLQPECQTNKCNSFSLILTTELHSQHPRWPTAATL